MESLNSNKHSFMDPVKDKFGLQSEIVLAAVIAYKLRNISGK